MDPFLQVHIDIQIMKIMLEQKVFIWTVKCLGFFFLHYSGFHFFIFLGVYFQMFGQMLEHSWNSILLIYTNREKIKAMSWVDADCL